jgi:hypothetical protein
MRSSNMATLIMLLRSMGAGLGGLFWSLVGSPSLRDSKGPMLAACCCPWGRFVICIVC